MKTRWVNRPIGLVVGVLGTLLAIAGSYADWVQYPTAGQRVRTLLLLALSGTVGWLLSALQAERRRRRALEAGADDDPPIPALDDPEFAAALGRLSESGHLWLQVRLSRLVTEQLQALVLDRGVDRQHHQAAARASLLLAALGVLRARQEARSRGVLQ